MDMSGWDVIYASSVAKLNEILAQSSQQLLPSFSYSNDAMQINFQGTFGPWAIRPGGSANRINIQVPVKTGTLNAPGFSDFQLNGIEPLLNVALTLIENKSQPGTQDLSFDFKDISTDPGTSKDGDIYMANPDESGLLIKRDPSKTVAAIISDNLPKCFIQNADKISFVFASLFMAPSGKPWLTPKATGITYFSSQDGLTQAVAIKTLTQSPWDAGGLSTAVDPSLLNVGNTLFYALSKSVFMKNILLPAIPKSIGTGVTADAFRFVGPTQPNQQNQCSIVNNYQFDMPSVENAGIHYYPKITHYSMVINNNRITTTASGKFDVTGLAGAWVEFNNLTVVNELYYDPNTKTIKFNLLSKSEPSVDKHIPWEYWLLGIAGLIGLIVRAIIEIVVTVVDNTVQNALTGQGDFSVIDVPMDTVSWEQQASFNIDTASLEEAFVIRGKS